MHCLMCSEVMLLGMVGIHSLVVLCLWLLWLHEMSGVLALVRLNGIMYVEVMEVMLYSISKKVV